MTTRDCEFSSTEETRKLPPDLHFQGFSMRRLIFAAAAAFAFLSPARADEPVPLAQLPRVAVPQHYLVHLTIDPKAVRFSGHAEIDVTFKESRKAIFIDARDMHLARAAARLPSGKIIPAHLKQVHVSGIALMTFDAQVPAGNATLIFDYDAPYNESLAGLYKVESRGKAYAFTQFENTDARRAFPSFDEPGFKTPFDISVTAPAEDKVVGNTPIASAKTANGMTTSVFETTKPLPTYLVALAIGPLDIVDNGSVPPSAVRTQPVPLRGVTAAGHGTQLGYALQLTPKVVSSLENYFGIAFPFQKLDVLAVPDFAAGAMENAGAITFRENYLLLLPDASLDQKRSSMILQTHETTHQWFGDLVTPKWWDDIWLNESFAEWMEGKDAQMVRPDQDFGRETLVGGLEVMDLDELPSARQIREPVNNPDDIDNAFDDITYDKGAAVLEMFESYLGDEAWRAGIHAYLTKFAGGNATQDDFIGTIAADSRHPEIVPAFHSYIDQPGIPFMRIALACEDGKSIAHVTQSMYTRIGLAPKHRQWNVPMCFEAGGKKVCKLIDTQTATVPLGGACNETVMPNADGKGYYRFAFDEAGWRALIDASPKLNAADQVTLFYNVYAAMRAGQASATDFFDATAKLAPVAKWDLLDAMRAKLHELRLSLLAPADMAAYRAFVGGTFRARLNAAGLLPKANDSVPNALARERLIALMVSEARDPATIAALAPKAQAYLDSDGKNAGGLTRDVLTQAVRAGLISRGPAFSDAVFTAFTKTDDEDFRRAMISAASISEDRAFLDRVTAYALTPKLRVGDMFYVQRYFEQEPAARAALWNWLKTNFAAIEKRESPDGMSDVSNVMQDACSADAKTDLHAFVAPKTKELTGSERPLAENEERIDLCMALKQAKGAEIEAALKAAR
jgi:alanyl aminopeptidase